ncbi:hypothetical protein QBC45DRAFT_191594 [Copromyces sp. CBS 386.78]|nr:hypothetical protein QBC45DRAFT_191594 [Copromyces sp. CBS 386.78]
MGFQTAHPAPTGGFRPPTFGVVPKSRSDVRQPTRISSTHVVVEPIPTKDRPWVPPDGLYTELHKSTMHERKLAIIGVDDRLLRPLPLDNHPFHALDYIPLARSSLEAFEAIESGLKSVAKKVLGVELSPVVPRHVTSIRESGWRPTQLGVGEPPIRWPIPLEGEGKDKWEISREFQSDWYEILWTDLMRRAYRWAEKYFDNQGADVGVSAKSVKDWTPNLWKQAGVSDQFVHYASLVARQDNNHPAGWDVLLAKGRYRKFLVVGVLVRLLQEQVFDELLFGADRETKRMLEAQDECYIEMDGYLRTEMRSQSVRAALGEYILTPNFWPEVDKLAIQTTALFSPLIRFMDVELEKRIDPLEFHQEIHDIIAEAGYFNIAMRLSRDVFRFNWPLPGDAWSFEVENVDDVPFEISRAWADKHEEDAQKRYRAGLEAERRREKRRKETPRTSAAMARGALRLALDGASTKLKSGLSATASKLARLRPGFVAPTVHDPPPSDPDFRSTSGGPELYLPSRLAKTQIAIFPTVQRYMNLETTRRNPVKQSPRFSQGLSFHTNDIMASIETHPTYEYYVDKVLPRKLPHELEQDDNDDDDASIHPIIARHHKNLRKKHMSPFDRGYRQEDAVGIHLITKGNAVYYSGVADESNLSALRRSNGDANVGPEKYYVGYPGYLPEHIPTLREWTNLPLTSRHSSQSFSQSPFHSSRTSSSLLTRLTPSTKTLILTRRLLYTLAIYSLFRFLVFPLFFPSLLPFFLALESTALHVFHQIKDGLATIFVPIFEGLRPLFQLFLRGLTFVRDLTWAILRFVLAPLGYLAKKVLLPPLAMVLRAVGYLYTRLVRGGPVGWVWGKLRGLVGRWGDWVEVVDDRVRGGLEAVDGWLVSTLGAGAGGTFLPEAWRRSGSGAGEGGTEAGAESSLTTTTTLVTTTTTTTAAAVPVDGGGGGNWNPFAWGAESELKTEKVTSTLTTNWDDEVFTRIEKRTVKGGHTIESGGLTSKGRTSTPTASTVTTGDGTFTIAGAAPPPPLTQ